jgi:arabinofuranan 3-O-arabinosyltransferase
LRAVEIFKVDASTSMVKTYPVKNPVIVSGDVSSLLPLAGVGDVGDRAAVLAGDPLTAGASAAKGATWAITDGNQREVTSFGSIRYNQSYVLSKGQTLPGHVAGVPINFAVVPGEKHETIEAPIGAASVAASSYGPTPLAEDPNDGPAAAFDGDPQTSWVSNFTNHSVGQWVSITFKHPIDLSTIKLTPLVGSPQQPTVSRVTIKTDRGSVSRSVPASGSPIRLSVPPGESSHLRITIAAVRPPKLASKGGIVLGAGITDVSIPHVNFQQQLKLPDDIPRSDDASKSNSPVVLLNRPIANANLSLGLNSTDDPSMAREFSLPKSMSAHITGYAVAQPGPALESLLERLAPSPKTSLGVTASSWFGGLPRFRPENLDDGSGTPWIAGLGDEQPYLDLTWNQPRMVSAISLTPSPVASRPTEISITSPAGNRLDLPVPKTGGVIHFSPLMTNSLRIEFVAVAKAVSVTPTFGVQLTVPVGLARVAIPGLIYSAEASLNSQTTVNLPCGQGPPILLDGHQVDTSVSGTIGDLVSFKPMRIVACTPAGGLHLSAGTHTFEAKTSAAPFSVSTVAIQSAHSTSASSAPPRTTKIGQWTSANRSIEVSPGPATYLVVSQNYNAGWVAKIGNVTLKPVRIDGWQQGYIIPADKSGTVHMVMQPDSLFRKLLLLGAVLLLLLLLLAVLPPRREVRVEPSEPRTVRSSWLLFAGAIIALALVAGPLALVLVPLVLIARRWGREVVAVIAFAAFVIAGVAAAWNPAVLNAGGSDAFGRQAQIASVIALAAVLAALVVETRTRVRKRRRAADSSPADSGPADSGTSDSGTSGVVTSDSGTSDSGTSDSGTSGVVTSGSGTSGVVTSDH